MATEIVPQDLPFLLYYKSESTHDLRVRDTDLGERLGYSRPSRIRELIKSYEKNLKQFSDLPVQRQTYENGGRPFYEYFLDRQQALFICLKSETDKAFEVQVEVIKVYDHYLKMREQPKQPATPQDYISALEALIASEKAKAALAAQNAALQRDNALLNTVIDNEFGYSSIIRAATHLGIHESVFKWQTLKKRTLEMGLEIKRAPSPRFEYQNLYPIAAFAHCYPEYDFSGLQPEAVAERAVKLLAGNLMEAVH